jgi:hypothetical protein
MLHRDQTLLTCERVNEASPRLPDGRVLPVTMGAPRCIHASRTSTAKYRDSLLIPEALASGTCLFLLSPSELGTIGPMVATVCQLRRELQEYSHPALTYRQRECSMRRRKAPLNRAGRRREARYQQRRMSEPAPEKTSTRTIQWFAMALLCLAVVVLLARIFRLIHP